MYPWSSITFVANCLVSPHKIENTVRRENNIESFNYLFHSLNLLSSLPTFFALKLESPRTIIKIVLIKNRWYLIVILLQLFDVSEKNHSKIIPCSASCLVRTRRILKMADFDPVHCLFLHLLIRRIRRLSALLAIFISSNHIRGIQILWTTFVLKYWVPLFKSKSGLLRKRILTHETRKIKIVIDIKCFYCIKLVENIITSRNPRIISLFYISILLISFRILACARRM